MTRVPILLAALTLVGASPPVIQISEAWSAGEFYRGKQINVLIGFGPGGANDAWARTLARHMGKHIPGNPTIVPQNVPGAGTLKLTNQLYNVVPKDGSVFGLISRGVPLEPLLGGQAIQFEPTRMNWIGSPDRDTTVCASRKDAKVQTMRDLFSQQLTVGASGSGADTAIYPEFLAEFLGMKFKTIKGYPGSNEIFLAMERNEVDGICVAHESLARQRLFTEGKMNILFQAALERDAKLPAAVPLATELATTEPERSALKLFLARVALGRPFVAPPEVASDRVETLRRAFDITIKDADFVSDANRQKLSVDPISGREIADTITAAYRTPKDVVKRVADTLGRIAK